MPAIIPFLKRLAAPPSLDSQDLPPGLGLIEKRASSTHDVKNDARLDF